MLGDLREYLNVLGVRQRAGLQRDGRIAASIEGTNIRRSALNDLNPDLHDDLRLVALN